MSAIPLAHAYPMAQEIRVEQQQLRLAPKEADGLDRILARMHHAYAIEGKDERDALVDGLVQLREEMAPNIRTPRGARTRPPSRKAKRRICAALDHFIAEARARG